MTGLAEREAREVSYECEVWAGDKVTGWRGRPLPRTRKQVRHRWAVRGGGGEETRPAPRQITIVCFGLKRRTC